ncbi:MAG: ATP-binding cassette domain-containing protein [Gammaproteobacteria bacterium]|nr:ATP-binding cassette domain-containing protein [Gammaproteobacteria bacterium]
MPELTLQDVCVAHVGPINLQLKAGEIVCLSGASGSGKSLLLRAVADIIPHTGMTTLDAAAADSMPAPRWRQQVGLLPAENQWWLDDIGEHFPRQDTALLMGLGFSEASWQWQVARCSTGEKQRLALLRLLCNQPRCLLLDEPTASLDPENIARVEAVLRDYIAQHQAPVLWVSHAPDQIQRVATRHYRLQDGKLVPA